VVRVNYNEDYEGPDDAPPRHVELPPVWISKLFTALCRKSKREGGRIKGQIIVMCQADVVKLWDEMGTSRRGGVGSTIECGNTDLVIRHPCIGGPRCSIKVKIGKVKPGTITFRKRKEWLA